MAVIRDFALPDRPDHPVYKELADDIENDPDRERALTRWRYAVDRDYWLFVATVSNFRDYRISEPTHKNRGKRWIDEPWIFDRCRELQYDIEAGTSDCAYNFPRFYFKTTLITIHGTEWELLRDPSLTFGIFTHKLVGAGSDWFSTIMAEFETNDRMLDLYPDRLYRNKRNYRNWNLQGISIKRPAGIREPSVSVYSIDNLPTNAHFHRIVGDDIVVRETLNSAEAMRQAEDGMQNLRFLAHENTKYRWVYTVYDAEDANQKAEKKGTFVVVHKASCFVTDKVTRDGAPLEWNADSDTADWQPVLHSRDFLEAKRRELANPYLFACQMMNFPIARGEQGNKIEWVKYYPKRPADQAKDLDRYLLIDPAGEKKEEREGDFWTWWVVGPGLNGGLYAYDCWRERLIQAEAVDLTFALVRHWRPKRAYLEGFGADHLGPALRREMAIRRFQFDIVTMNDHTPKVRRIQNLQGDFRQGRVWFPIQGFGHGSGPFYLDTLRISVRDPDFLEPRARNAVSDGRDTKDQFFDDEYLKWSPIKGTVLYDDLIDGLAWPSQSQYRSVFFGNERPGVEEEPQYGLRTQHPPRRKDPLSGINAWAF